MARIATDPGINSISCLNWSVLVLTLFDAPVSANGILPFHPPRSLGNLCGPRYNDARYYFLCLDIFRLLRTPVSWLTVIPDWVRHRHRRGRLPSLLQDIGDSSFFASGESSRVWAVWPDFPLKSRKKSVFMQTSSSVYDICCPISFFIIISRWRYHTTPWRPQRHQVGDG